MASTLPLQVDNLHHTLVVLSSWAQDLFELKQVLDVIMRKFSYDCLRYVLVEPTLLL